MERASNESVQRLQDDHARVLEIIRQLEPFLERDTAPVEPDFARLRWSLVRELTQHLAMERSVLSGGSHPGSAAAEYDGGFAATFNNHIARWTGAQVHDHWAGYSRAARTLLARLRRQIRHEETVLFPQLR